MIFTGPYLLGLSLLIIGLWVLGEAKRCGRASSSKRGERKADQDQTGS